MQKQGTNVMLGRFGSQEFLAFLGKLNGATSDSWAQTPTELVIDEIENSISEDLIPHVHPHKSGNDVKSIAMERIEGLQEPLKQELLKVEADQVGRMLKIVKQFDSLLQSRLTMIAGSQTMGDQRQAEIDGARASAGLKLQGLG